MTGITRVGSAFLLLTILLGALKAQAQENHYRLSAWLRVSGFEQPLETQVDVYLGPTLEYQDRMQVFVRFPGEQAFTDVWYHERLRVTQLYFSEYLTGPSKSNDRPATTVWKSVQSGAEYRDLNFIKFGFSDNKGPLTIDWTGFEREVFSKAMTLQAAEQNGGKPLKPAGSGQTFESEGNTFTLTVSDRGLELYHEGKSVVIDAGAKMLPAKSALSIQDGLLTIKDVRRVVDLRAFQGEVDYNGNSRPLAPVRGKDGYLSEEQIYQIIDSAFPDLVAKERRRLQRGESIELEPVSQSQALTILSHLKKGKSVKYLGDPGTGKSTDVKMIARWIARGELKGVPRTFPLRDVKVSNFTAGTGYVGTQETITSAIISVGTATRAAWFVDEAHNLEGAGTSEGKPSNAAQDFKGPLEDRDLRMIWSSTESEFDNAFSSDPALESRFIKVQKVEPAGEELDRILRNAHRVEGLPVPSNDVIHFAVVEAKKYAIDGSHPREGMNVLRSAHTFAEQRLINAGEDPAQAVATIEDAQKALISVYGLPSYEYDPKRKFEVVTRVRGEAGRRLVGMEAAINETVNFVFNKTAGVQTRNGAVGGLLYYGPPGTGKTLITSVVGQATELHVAKIDMTKFGSGGKENELRYEIYQVLKKSAKPVIRMDEFEKAPHWVQNEILAMTQEGEFEVSFKDKAGRLVVRKVNCRNAIFLLTSNAGTSLLTPRADRVRVSGLSGSTQAQTPAAAAFTEEQETEALVQDNLSRPVASRMKKVAVRRPTREQFRQSLTNELHETLRLNSEKFHQTFKLENETAMIDGLMSSYQENVTDHRKVEELLRDHLLPLISQATIDPKYAEASALTLRWSAEIPKMSFPLTDCNLILIDQARSSTR